MRMKGIGVVLCLLLLLSGCANEKTAAPQIEDYSWQMTIAQSMEAEGQAIAHKPGTDGVPDTSAEVILVCAVENEKITLTDETNNQAYTGTYKLTDSSRESSIYEIIIGDTEGMAVVSMTTYQNESQTPTLIISLDDYTLNFFGGGE